MTFTEEVEYVEVPVYREVIKQVPKKQIIEIKSEVPNYVYDYVDKYVDVPEIQYVDKIVEVPQVHKIIKQVPRKEIVEVPKEVVKHVPKIERKVVEKIVEVPGEVIEVPKPYLVENKVVVPKYIKEEVPVVVAQTLMPSITESQVESIEVVLNEYVPKLVLFDVFVPKPVMRQAISKKCVDEYKIVDVPGPQWNTLMMNANPNIDPSDLKEYMAQTNDSVVFSSGPGTYIVKPENDEWRECKGEDDYAKLRYYNVPDSTEYMQKYNDDATHVYYEQMPTQYTTKHMPNSQVYTSNVPNSQVYTSNIPNSQYTPTVSYSPNHYYTQGNARQVVSPTISHMGYTPMQQSNNMSQMQSGNVISNQIPTGAKMVRSNIINRQTSPQYTNMVNRQIYTK